MLSRITKIFRKSSLISQMMILSPVLLLIRLFRPIYLIRLGPLHSHRIGHFCGNTEIYLCEKEEGLHGGKRVLDLFYFVKPICNQQLQKMWKRVLSTHSFFRPLDLLNRLIPGGKAHQIPMGTDRDVHGLMMKTLPHLQFTPEEQERGQCLLQKIGINKEDRFICFSSRDSAYLQSVFSHISWSYHDYRDCNVLNYLSAAETLTQRGYIALRMGAVVKEPLQVRNTRIIDYARRDRSDFMDIYLSARCSFFICSTEGLYAVPAIFRRPAVHVNIIPIGDAPTFLANDLFIPKKLWLKTEKRYLTFQEIMQLGICHYHHSHQFYEKSLEIHENSAEEILEITLEMDDRLKGQWRGQAGDAELQARFWEIFSNEGPKQAMGLKIGADFLRKNRELLK